MVVYTEKQGYLLEKYNKNFFLYLPSMISDSDVSDAFTKLFQKT